VQWDEQDHSAYFYFYRDQMREWIYFTDLHTFVDRYQLVQKSGIQGFCSWVLGEEDPQIWAFLPRHNEAAQEPAQSVPHPSNAAPAASAVAPPVEPPPAKPQQKEQPQ
jgi:hypothetical protein